MFPLNAEQPLQRAEKRASVERSMTAAEASSRLAEGDLICYRHFEYSSQCTLTGAEPARLTCLLCYCISKAINDFTHLDAIITIANTHLLRKSGHSKPTDACIKPPNCGLPI